MIIYNQFFFVQSFLGQCSFWEKFSEIFCLSTLDFLGFLGRGNKNQFIDNKFPNKKPKTKIIYPRLKI